MSSKAKAHVLFGNIDKLILLPAGVVDFVLCLTVPQVQEPVWIEHFGVRI